MPKHDGFLNKGMKDNIDFAVYCKLNELADRYGIKPYDFVALLEDGPGEDMRLKFADHPPSAAAAARQYDTMLRSLGIADESNCLEAPVERIIDALDNALHVAPRARPRS